MKRKYLWGFALCMLLTTACNDNELVEVQPFETIASATVEMEDVRSLATDEGVFTWNKGDKISVYTSSGNFRTFDLKGNGGTATADFSGILYNNETTAKCAAYPNGSHSLSGNTLTFNLPAEYGSFDAEYVENTNAALVAPIADGSMDFNFRHIAGVLRFKLDNVPADAAQFVFTATDKDITGDFDVDITETLPSISARAKTDANSVTIKFKSLTEAQDDMIFFIPLPVGTYNGFNIAIKKQDGTLLVEYTHEGSNEMTRKFLARFPEMRFTDMSGTIDGEEQAAGTLVNSVAKLAEAGTLAEVLGDEMLTLTSLKIVGEINGADIKCLRQMLGGESAERGKLTTLDLSETIIVESSDVYYNNLTTYNNVFGEDFFYNCYQLTEIELPNTITEIGYSALGSCNIADITIPSTVTSITGAFPACTSLMNINVDNANESYTSIDGVLYNKAQTTLVEFPAGRDNATFYDGITSIADNAFLARPRLTEIVMPNSVKEIGVGAFFSCINLSNITLSNELSTIGNSAFANCMKLNSIVIPGSVTEIGKYAFSGCSNLTDITLNEGLKTIGESAFSSLNFTTITIPNSVTTIGDEAFRYCQALMSVVLGESVETIGKYAFYQCELLNSITFPNSLTVIGEYALGYCALTNVTLPNNIKNIYNVFYGCPNLQEVTIPNIAIWRITTSNNGKNADVQISDFIAWCKVGGLGIFSNQYLYLNGSMIEDLVIPNEITTIKEGTFRSCTGLKSITIPDHVTMIENSAFQRCSNVSNVVIGNSVTTIGNYAFADCNSLTNVVIGKNVSTIGSCALDNSWGLEKVKCLANTPPTLANTSANYYPSFNGINNSAILYVPLNSIATYENSEWKSYFTNIEELSE